jgi:hypothetical protein
MQVASDVLSTAVADVDQGWLRESAGWKPALAELETVKDVAVLSRLLPHGTET